MEILQWLNQYANAFLALLTLIYVALTYRTLRALRRESTREHRLRHLGDIKEKVVGPAHHWISSAAIPVLEGNLFAVSCQVKRVEREATVWGERAYDERVELGVLTPSAQLGGHLFYHAKDVHFPDQLGALSKFIEDFQRLMGLYLTAARQWADDAAGATSFRRINTTSTGPGDFADADYLVALCLSCLISGNRPDLGTKHPTPDTTEFADRRFGRLVGRGETGEIRAWIDAAWEIASRGWEECALGAETKNTLLQARLVREYIGRLQLTYDLGGDCEYIGGNGGWRLWRFLRLRAGGWLSGATSSLGIKISGWRRPD